LRIAPTFKAICEELEKAGGLLAIAEQGMPPGEEVAQVWYVRGLMRAMVAAAQDLVLLVRNDRYQNVICLCRVGFESRINLGAAIRVRDFAAQKLLGDTLENCRALEELLKQDPGDVRPAAELKNQEELLRTNRANWGPVKERCWKYKEAAHEAGLDDEYRDHYPLLSRGAHNR
jgi:hypothetical protein